MVFIFSPGIKTPPGLKPGGENNYYSIKVHAAEAKIFVIAQRAQEFLGDDLPRFGMLSAEKSLLPILSVVGLWVVIFASLPPTLAFRALSNSRKNVLHFLPPLVVV